MCDIPDSQTHFFLYLSSYLIHWSHQQLPQEKARSTNTLSILLRLGIEKPENHLDKTTKQINGSKTKNWQSSYLLCNENVQSFSVAYLEHYQNAADNAGISIDHGLLHNVTDAAEVTGFDGMLFTQQGFQGQTVAAGCQQVQLVNTHSTYMMK